VLIKARDLRMKERQEELKALARGIGNEVGNAIARAPIVRLQ
jgi:hypothetical protein